VKKNTQLNQDLIKKKIKICFFINKKRKKKR